MSVASAPNLAKPPAVKTIAVMVPPAIAEPTTLGHAPDVEALARKLGIPRKTVVAQRCRFPDGTTFYPPRFRWSLLVKAVLEQFVPCFFPGGVVVHLRDSETPFLVHDSAYLAKLGVTLDAAARIPDLVVHDVKRNWLILIEAVTSAGPVDDKRLSALKQLFKGSTAGLVFVTAFETRKSMQAFLDQISWESEVWIAEAPEHLIHFNGERFLGPYPDAMPANHRFPA